MAVEVVEAFRVMVREAPFSLGVDLLVVAEVSVTLWVGVLLRRGKVSAWSR